MTMTVKKYLVKLLTVIYSIPFNTLCIVLKTQSGIYFT